MSLLGTKKGLSLERLAAFLEVLDAGGIARAAPGQPVRQSQLSRQISELESALGAQLFDRSAQGPRTPTSAGAQLARVVRELRRGLDDVAAADIVSCTLGAGDSSLRWLLLPNVRAVAGARVELGVAGVELHVGARSSEEIAQELADGTLDFGVVRSTTPLPQGVKVARLGVLEYALFSHRGGPTRDQPLAIATGEPALAAQLAPFLSRIARRVALRCETFPQVAAAVNAGYAGVLPTIARAEIEARLARGLVRGPVLARATLVLAWRARLDVVRPALLPVRRTLIGMLRAALRNGDVARRRGRPR